MAVQDPYCTRDQVKAWVEVTDALDDTQIDTAIVAASRWIDEYCQRSFNQVTESRALDACGWQSLRLGEFGDLVSLTTLRTDDDMNGVYETTWDAADRQLLPLTAPTRPDPRPYTEIRSTGTKLFPRPTCIGRVGLVEVTGVWGWPEVPEAVHQAALIQSTRVLKRRNSPEGLTGWGNEFGPVRLSIKADPDVERLLSPYRRTVVLVA